MLAACGAPDERGGERVLRLGGETMGTTWSATVVLPEAGPGAADPEAGLRAEIEQALALVDEQMSTWREDSELSRFNRHRSTAPFPFSAETLEVLRLAREVSVATAGAFDVTVGPLVDAWGFGARRPPPGAGPPPAPADEALFALRDRVGFERLALDPAAGTATKAHPELEVDVAAIAPGFAVDLISERLRGRGFDRHLIEIGGELRVSGANPDGERWRIAIERPQTARRESQRVLEVKDAAVATSGDYRDFYEIDGTRYSHSLDPSTGRPVRHSLASATVIHPSCALADAWATAMMVLGPERGLEAAEENGLAVLLLVYEGAGVRELASGALARFTAGGAGPAAAFEPLSPASTAAAR